MIGLGKLVPSISCNVKDTAKPPFSIKSAVANATNNFNMNEETLFVKTAYVDDGIRMKRYMPRAKGSASGLVKRTCHITIVVADE